MYVFFRGNTYVSILLEKVGIAKLGEISVSNRFLIYLSFYLPDFLWALGLCCDFFVIFNNGFREAVICGAISFLCGSLWEVLQYANVVKGTGDTFDIIMYLIAVIIALLLYKRRENYEKND